MDRDEQQIAEMKETQTKLFEFQERGRLSAMRADAEN